MIEPSLGSLAGVFANPPRPFDDVPLRYRRATVNSVQSTTPPTVTITFFGSSTSVAGVRYPRGSAPVAGDIAEVISAGSASFVVAILA